jgi:GNAT superfamily N-acetyltransferase
VDDADALMSLRREALETHPLAFVASVEDDVGLSPEFVRRSLADTRAGAVFGHFEADALTGMVGLVHLSRVKTRHAGMIWGMYVSARSRRRGAGRALLEAAIDQARAWGLEQVRLGVTEAAPEARRLYESAGFRAWGLEPRALAWQGHFVDEHHMTLHLRDPGGPS